MDSIRNLRYVALAEATGFLVLLVAVYFKYANDQPAGVQIMGPVHGLLFLMYVLLTINVRTAAGWSTRMTIGILLGAVIPFGGYVVDRRLAHEAIA